MLVCVHVLHPLLSCSDIDMDGDCTASGIPLLVRRCWQHEDSHYCRATATVGVAMAAFWWPGAVVRSWGCTEVTAPYAVLGTMLSEAVSSRSGSAKGDPGPALQLRFGRECPSHCGSSVLFIRGKLGLYSVACSTLHLAQGTLHRIISFTAIFCRCRSVSGR
jgi:hypothetical protein